MRRGMLHAEHHTATRVAIAASKRGNRQGPQCRRFARAAGVVEQTIDAANFSTACPISARISSSTVTSVWRKMQLPPSFSGQRLASARAARR